MTIPDSTRFLRKLDWNLLKTFAEIVRFGGVSKAARAIYRQQPSVSSALKRLEDHLGVTLCSRGPGGFQLTDHGKALAEVCAKVEQQLLSLPAAFDEISGEFMYEVRLLVVGNLVSKRLDSTIARFSHMYPRAELLINVAPCTEIEDHIMRQDAEIGVAPVANLHPELDYVFLYREQHMPVCGRKHPLYGTTLDDVVRLSEEAFVLPGTDEADQVRNYRQRYSLGTRIAGKSTDLNEVRRMVGAGIGIAVLPTDFMQADIDSGAIWQLIQPQPDLQDDIYIITNPKNTRQLAVSKFLELLPVD